MTPTAILNSLIALVSGGLFSLGLMVSGMVNPEKVKGFLDLFGDWDPSLAFVMAPALAVFSIGFHLLVKNREKAVSGCELNIPKNNRVDSNLITGAVIFGAGWGLVGLCPGPVLANIALLDWNIFVFILAMLIGMKLVGLFKRQPDNEMK